MSNHGEPRVIVGVIVGFGALGLASAIWPAVEHTASVAFAVLFGLAGLGVLAYLVRQMRRELLFRAEMRAFDRRDAARAAASDTIGSTAGGGRR